MATLHILFLLMAGLEARSGPLYFLFSVGGTAESVGIKLWRVDPEDPDSCLWWFSRGALISGATTAGGLIADYMANIL